MAEKDQSGSGSLSYRYHMWFRVGWSCCPSFCVFACPLLQTSVCLPLSWGVILGHFSTLCDRDEQQLFDTGKLNNTNTEKSFKLELNNRFNVLQEEQEMKISNRQHEARESTRSRRGRCRDAESERRRHHRKPYRDVQGNMGKRRNTRPLRLSLNCQMKET